MVEEPSFRKLLRQAVPSLCQLDDYELIKLAVNSKIKGKCYVPDIIANSYIYAVCLQQESREQDMKEKHNNTMRYAKIVRVEVLIYRAVLK